MSCGCSSHCAGAALLDLSATLHLRALNGDADHDKYRRLVRARGITPVIAVAA